MIMVGAMAAARGYGVRQQLDVALVRKALARSAWIIARPVVVVGGIYSGWVTPTEVAAVVVVYGLAVATLVYRSLSLRDLVIICRNTARVSAMLYFVLVGASLFGFVMTAEGVPQQIVEWVQASQLGPSNSWSLSTSCCWRWAASSTACRCSSSRCR